VGEANRPEALIKKPGQSNSRNWGKILAPYRKEFHCSSKEFVKATTHNFLMLGPR